MKRFVATLIGLLPLASLARAQLPGQTYVAKMGEACAATSTGGCWKTFYYRLHFGRDSVTVSWVMKAVCSNQNEAATTRIDTIQTQRYAYHLLDQPRQVAIPGFQLAPLLPTDNYLTGQRPTAEGGGQVVFEVEATPHP